MNKLQNICLLLFVVCQLAEFVRSNEIEESPTTESTPLDEKEENESNKQQSELKQPLLKMTDNTTTTITPTPTTTETTIKIDERIGNINDKLVDNGIEEVKTQQSEERKGPVPCTCGVFLSGQFKKGSKDQPKGVPVLVQETDNPFLNNAMGNRQCTNKCLELIIKHLPKSSEIICATVDRDEVFKERAYLFIKNRTDKWHGTNLSAGREFCCRNYAPYKCPMS